MAVAAAIAELHGLDLDTLALARIAGRGGTSGVGVESFRAGGFIVEGGHKFGGPNGKRDFTPSASSRGFDPGPVLFRHAFPTEWSILIATPTGATIHSDQENELFRKICPLPASEVGELARIILMQLMPSLIEKDLESFGQAIQAVQQTGFKRHEVATQTPWVNEVRTEMQRIGLHGVGMSSWGPALYAFGSLDQVQGAHEHLTRYMANGDGGSAFITTANNTGAVIQSE
jgi:beta-ribofuranosylaminobenzene 5'-phosphate synthase